MRSITFGELDDQVHEWMILFYPCVAGQRRTFALSADGFLQLTRFFVLWMVVAQHRPDNSGQVDRRVAHVEQAHGRRDEAFVATQLPYGRARHPRHLVRDVRVAEAVQGRVPVPAEHFRIEPVLEGEQ